MVGVVGKCGHSCRVLPEGPAWVTKRRCCQPGGTYPSGTMWGPSPGCGARLPSAPLPGPRWGGACPPPPLPPRPHFGSSADPQSLQADQASSQAGTRASEPPSVHLSKLKSIVLSSDPSALGWKQNPKERVFWVVTPVPRYLVLMATCPSWSVCIPGNSVQAACSPSSPWSAA